MALHSFVLPIFNEEEVIDELWRRLKTELLQMVTARGDQVEVIFVDDGSRDLSFSKLTAIQEQNRDEVTVLKFSRNFGHQVAITAGIDHARGDSVTVLDADLQDPPAVVVQMIEKWRGGADIVSAVREKRLKESAFKLFTAAIFYRLLRASANLDIQLDSGDFRLMSRKAVDALKSLREKHRFVRGMVKWVGFKHDIVMYVREARFAGETKYPFRKMVALAWDAFTGFSLLPVRLATYLGLGAAVLSFALGAWALIVHFFTDSTVPGWTSIVLATAFFGGVQLFCIGILGEYVGRIFEESKRRPLYLLESVLTANSESNNKPR